MHIHSTSSVQNKLYNCIIWAPPQDSFEIILPYLPEKDDIIALEDEDGHNASKILKTTFKKFKVSIKPHLAILNNGFIKYFIRLEEVQ